MFKRIGLFVAAISVLVLAYLLTWPVPVSPVAWDAPQDLGLVDPFEANDRLAKVVLIDLGEHESPEDIAGRDGFIYASTLGGKVIRMRNDGSGQQVFADTGGRPLGIEFDHKGNLLVANARLGLQQVTADGAVTTLLAESSPGEPVYPNDVAVAMDGRIYFSESSSKFSGAKYADSYDASLLAIIEHGGHGRIFEFDPESGQTRVIMSGLNYANGVAISDDQQFLLVSETAGYRIWRHALQGPDRGQSTIVLDNLPGFPDNINNGLNGRFWIGLVAPRNELVDRLSDKPWARKVILRLPQAIRPAAKKSSHIIGIDGNGTVLMNLQDTAAVYPSITGVYETREALFLSSLFGNRIARLDKTSLAVK
ncbi:MAG: SMP-30/gluconolactonase/LRE family protein [Gammaproteobacteria bacterium]|nr:SMP-30/gluconolactonase/LRE family protein [Gammaproteobacteria bacterium]MDH4313656.1 SMP-30/gluconolactonase/LRE family protein [Gammaproteobacteria bacterium]MDH5213869.1 SMP-30/gluconolactonase/LRE family protein [Gammaproteobacteria bacterium]MDH5500109.1 SMP-30/gluconolactonase/LRE family protein [Gammaproteobacteria bacterium]